ncbi:hypothetical protein Y1Q_0011642 [Alligator mississippiensis]|uniref:Uncharacterized protein n=1 Tax=Alligator mississippiensis TaxID=8496 RepID=A0A151M0N3_ALLMI|nr:hypothetical protein Y1Q_0011642 [Alligator mississippiensis]
MCQTEKEKKNKNFPPTPLSCHRADEKKNVSSFAVHFAVDSPFIFFCNSPPTKNFSDPVELMQSSFSRLYAHCWGCEK